MTAPIALCEPLRSPWKAEGKAVRRTGGFVRTVAPYVARFNWQTNGLGQTGRSRPIGGDGATHTSGLSAIVSTLADRTDSPEIKAVSRPA
jgi:hypothetical protein